MFLYEVLFSIFLFLKDILNIIGSSINLWREINIRLFRSHLLVCSEILLKMFILIKALQMQNTPFTAQEKFDNGLFF